MPYNNLLKDILSDEYLVTLATGVISSTLTGVIASLIAARIFLWFNERSKNRNRVLVLATKIRNILYEAERLLQRYDFSPCAMCHVVQLNPILIADHRLDRHQWTRWHWETDDIQAELHVLGNLSILDRVTNKLFKVDPKTVISSTLRTVEDHFKSIVESVELSMLSKNPQYLGLFECSIEAGNLIHRAESKYLDLVERIEEVNIFIKEKGPRWTYNRETDALIYPDSSGILCTKRKGDELEKVRQQIKLHREHLELICSR